MSTRSWSSPGTHLIEISAIKLTVEGLSEDQLALFDLLRRGDLTKANRERIKQASRDLMAGVLKVIATLGHWTEKEQTQAEVETSILNHIYQELPEPP